MFLRHGFNGWASIRGSCLIGRSNRRGCEFVLRSLESQGLIERRYLNTTRDKVRFSPGYDDIRTTDKGKQELGKTPVTDPLLIEIIETST